MAPVKPSVYVFDPKSITKTRGKLNLTQKQMSEQLGVPVNTLSRWETGSTTPDAKSLAAIHSLAAKQGHTPGFFKKAAKATTLQVTKAKANKGIPASSKRKRIVVMLDFQNLGVSAKNITHLNDWVMAQLKQVRSSINFDQYKAFARPDQKAAIKELSKLKWRIQESTDDLDKAIIQQSKSNCGQDPDSTTLFLITKDGDFAELVKELREWGAEVFVGGQQASSRKLISATGNQWWLQMPNSWG